MELRKAFELYIRSRINKNVSKKTLEKTETEIRVFLRFVDSNPELNFLELLPSDIERYLNETVKLGSAGTYNDRRGYLNRFYKYFVGNLKLTDSNPVTDVEKAIVVKEEEEEIKAIPSAAELMNDLKNDVNSQFYLRNLAVISLFLECGLRVGEMSNLKISDINFKEDEFTFLRKNRKIETMYLPKQSKRLIKNYLKHRNDNNEYLVVNGEGHNFSANYLSKEIKRLLKRMWLEEYSAHSLRHRCITDWLYILDLDIETVRILASHSDIKITQRYLNITKKEANNKLKQVMMGR